METQPFADRAVIDRDFLRSAFRSMLWARILENKLSSLYKAGMGADEVRARARATIEAYDAVYGGGK